MKPLVIYHANCTDGLAAAWCFKEYLDCDFYPGVYQMPVPDIVDRDVYLVDFSYPYDKMRDICQFANKVVLLDHHKTAIENCLPLKEEFDNFNMDACTIDQSGAVIAWLYVKQMVGHKDGVPRFLLHVEDRDLWKFKYPGTKEIIKAAQLTKLNLDNIGEYMKMKQAKMELLEKIGSQITTYEKTLMTSSLNECMRRIHIKSLCGTVDREIDVVNCFGGFFSELGEMFYKAHKASILMYYDTATHRVFGLRSESGVGEDVSVIAKAFGGGGHKHAAGFKVDRGHYLAQL